MTAIELAALTPTPITTVSRSSGKIFRQSRPRESCTIGKPRMKPRLVGESRFAQSGMLLVGAFVTPAHINGQRIKKLINSACME